MSAARPLQSLLLAAILVAPGCKAVSDTSSGPPPCVPADVAGVWNIHWVPNGDGVIPCYDTTRVWTIFQSGCDVTIQSDTTDPANGARGSAWDGRFRVEWIWYLDCHGIRETVDAAVDGNSMTGTYYRSIWREQYGNCAPGGVCSPSFTAVR